jgi:hypothetical protein
MYNFTLKLDKKLNKENKYLISAEIKKKVNRLKKTRKDFQKFNF